MDCYFDGMVDYLDRCSVPVEFSSENNGDIFHGRMGGMTRFGVQDDWLTLQKSNCNYRNDQVLVKKVTVVSTLAFNESSKTAI